ncbi:hypothetical protein HMPREF1624_02963 [Sporothrix schenckii ATCC 58251]|uniref:FAD dependent oxidoreductase domain-containing protein n=1 Tax=Sporothrix schenckii (strain ATCC 58251 / de Perez 2211183) TaxID=1391915 RepID=U7PVC4_SPOS1|nr:hypothetical protein HMPREF1624_02963 [Sporothrix schenckii ATCC 58251]
MADFVVVGAGVSGLTSSLTLAKAYPTKQIVVVAQNLPSDAQLPATYASAFAGANFMPMADAANSRWERSSWPEFARLAQYVPEAGVVFRDVKLLGRHKDRDTATGQWFQTLMAPDPWFATVVPGYRSLEPAEIPGGYDFGATFQSICINVPLYLQWLVGQCLQHGVNFRRQCLAHLNDAWTGPGVSSRTIVVNCTGLGAATLGGVQDDRVVPSRGQILLVQNELIDPSTGEPGSMIVTSGSDDSPDELCYIMQRPAGGGTVVGGCYQAGCWNTEIDTNLTKRITNRARAMWPLGFDQTTHANMTLDVVAQAVGFRPVRKGGVRVEKQLLARHNRWVVHNYGHGGWGYQGSYGCAEGVVELANEILETQGGIAKL